MGIDLAAITSAKPFTHVNSEAPIYRFSTVMFRAVKHYNAGLTVVFIPESGPGVHVHSADSAFLRAADERALIIDDDVEYGRVIADTLSGGYRSRIATTLDAARQRFHQLAPQVIVAERWMGDPGALLAFVRDVRAAHADLVILLTSNREMSLSEIMECWEADVDGWLLKPFHPRELAGRVGHIARRVAAVKAAPPCVHTPAGQRPVSVRHQPAPHVPHSHSVRMSRRT